MQKITAESLGFVDSPSPSPEIVPEYQELSLGAEDARKAAKESLDFLAALAMPTVFKYLFPIVFKSIWQFLVSYAHKVRDFAQIAIGLPRGFGKTMVVKIFVLYCVLFTSKKFILIIAGTQTKANNILTDIISMLDEKNIKSLFGDWRIGIETDRQDLRRFGFRGRTIILMAAGAGSDIRGITLENARPDIMIFDDIQTREDADSETVSNNIETWLIGTAMKAKSPEGCLFIFIANMYPTKHSLLRKLKHNPTWIKFIAGGIMADGTSLWEELQPVKQLLKEYQNDLSMGRGEIFLAEVLNDETASVNRLIDISKIPLNPYEGEPIHQGNFIIIDPSNDKTNSDKVAIIYCELFDGKPVVKEAIEERLSPGDIIRTALKIALTRNCRLIAVESNAFQYSLLYWFNFIANQSGIIGINCVDVYSGQRAKNSRILDMFKSLAAGEFYVASDCRASIFSQITGFNPLITKNTDNLLDCLTYISKVIELYSEFIASSLTLEMQENAQLEVSDESVTSPF